MRKAMILGVLGLAGTLASPAFAADEFSGFRLGMNLGSDKLESSFNSSAADGVETLNENRFSYGLFGGWALNKWLAAEGALNSGTEYNGNPFRSALAADGLFMDSHTKIKNAELTVVGSAWIGNKFAFFGRVGLSAYKAEERVTIGDLLDPTSRTRIASDKTGTAPVFGVGIQTVLDHALLRFEYKMSSIDDLRFIDRGDPADANDDVTVFDLHDSDTSSLTLSIVWVL